MYKSNFTKTNVIKNGKLEIVKDKLIVAGPCTITNKESIIKLAFELKTLGVNVIRGGCLKPRTIPYSFQGLEETALDYLMEVKKYRTINNNRNNFFKIFR